MEVTAVAAMATAFLIDVVLHRSGVGPRTIDAVHSPSAPA